MGETDVRFRTPPVQSVALTIYFEPLRALQVSHLAPIRERWRDQYPNVAELPPLRPLNRSNEGGESNLVPVGSAWPFPYVMFATEGEQQIIAIQSDRLVRSWTFNEGGDSYPGFATLATDLKQRLEELEELVASETDEELRLIGSECYYLNELPDMSPEALLVGVATRWAGDCRDAGFPNAHYAGFRLHLDDEEESELSANLMLDWDKGERPTLAIDTRYGPVDGVESELAGLHLAHDKLLEHFLAFTSESMQADWGRE